MWDARALQHYTGNVLLYAGMWAEADDPMITRTCSLEFQKLVQEQFSRVFFTLLVFHTRTFHITYSSYYVFFIFEGYPYCFFTNSVG